MLIDDVIITIVSGKGGKGAVAFNKNMMSLGPAGGSGGHGGSVYMEGIVDLGALRQFRFKKELHAEDGKDGRPQFNDGHMGSDLVLQVPVGTVIHNLTTDTDTEITKIGERVLLAKGGKGGKGNFHFRSPRNTSPRQFQSGLPGESFKLRLELKLIADVGFVGFPNAGKSSLLNELTRADVKVANYPFTTLEPNLGVFYDLVLADIPGIIEGASKGKGLGIKFLRHIERTNVLFHFISAESPTPIKDYRAIRKELGMHHKALLKKQEYIVLSKHDMISPADVKKRLAALKKIHSTNSGPVNRRVFALSIYDWDSLENIKKILQTLIDKKTAD